MSESIIIVGLGNPGTKYAKQRHNIGFYLIDELAKKHSFPKFSVKFNSLNSMDNISGTKVILTKPQSFMNLSGEPLGKLVNFYKIDKSKIIVIHDEIDLEFGKMKTKQGGGAAGHNGIRSIINHLGNDFIRIRVGIGRPHLKSMVTSFVLSDFDKQEKDWFVDNNNDILAVIEELITNNLTIK